MSQEAEVTTATVPITGASVEVQIPTPDPEGPKRIWQTDWFNSTTSKCHVFAHGLHLTRPWLCRPRLVGMVTTYTNGWLVGDVLFGDGANYLGDTSQTEMGWTIQVDADTIRVTFAQGVKFVGANRTGGYGGCSRENLKCKLVMNY